MNQLAFLSSQRLEAVLVVAPPLSLLRITKKRATEGAFYSSFGAETLRILA